MRQTRVETNLSSLLLLLALFLAVLLPRIHPELRLHLPRLRLTMSPRRQLLHVQVLCPSLCRMER